jgi:DNA-binding CsgD family transcriptional regulator
MGDQLRFRYRSRQPNLGAEREREIIEFFAKGATYDEVASLLSISVNTVRQHVRSLYRKLHVCTKAEAVTMAMGR